MVVSLCNISMDIIYTCTVMLLILDSQPVTNTLSEAHMTIPFDLSHASPNKPVNQKENGII